jgi:hypothetical protein
MYVPTALIALQLVEDQGREIVTREIVREIEPQSITPSPMLTALAAQTRLVTSPTPASLILALELLFVMRAIDSFSPQS